MLDLVITFITVYVLGFMQDHWWIAFWISMNVWNKMITKYYERWDFSIWNSYFLYIFHICLCTKWLVFRWAPSQNTFTVQISIFHTLDQLIKFGFNELIRLYKDNVLLHTCQAANQIHCCFICFEIELIMNVSGH